MRYKGIETEKFTEGEFLNLPRMGRKSLAEAKAMGATFREVPESDWDPTRGGVPVRSKVQRDRDEDGIFTAIPPVNRAPVSRREYETDQYGNVLDGTEEE